MEDPQKSDTGISLIYTKNEELSFFPRKTTYAKAREAMLGEEGIMGKPRTEQVKENFVGNEGFGVDVFLSAQQLSELSYS